MMKWFVRLLAPMLLCASLAVTWAAGTSATLTWTPPTTYIDGTTIQSEDLDHYTITWTGQTGALGSMTVKAPANTAVVPIVCGSVNFSITATTGATAAYPNATSASTPPLAYVATVKCTPNPPSGLVVH